MKSFHQFLTEAENSIPLDLSEAVEWFSIFDEELSEVDKLEVLEELSEEDLINLAWLKEYLYEAELVPGAVNKRVKFKRPKFDKLDKLLNQIRNEPSSQGPSSSPSATSKPKVTPNSQQYSQQAGPQRPVSNLKISKSGLEAARDVARNRTSLPPPPPGVKRASWELNNKGASQASAPASPSRLRQSVSNLGRNIKSKLPPAPKVNVPSGLKGAAGVAGRAVVPASTAVSAALDVADERAKGSGWARSLAKGATVAAGGLLGGTLGAVGGGGVGSLALGAAGMYGGSQAAGAAFDTVAGANAVQRKAMATANRQRQAGGGLAGIGGKTTFSKGKGGTGFMSTGSGSQRKTVQLAKTSVVKDPKTGKAETGHLAFKGGQAVYKRAADPSTLAKTSSNPLERVGRSLFAGAYKDQDEKARQAKLKQAAQSDIKRQQALGVKGSQNLVGPKIVGPKIVGPKPTPSKPAGGGMGGARGSGSSPGSLKPTTK